MSTTPASPIVTERPLSTTVLVEVRGTEAEVKAGVEEYLKLYHPLGYDTCFGKPTPTVDGVWVARGTRLKSCD